MEKQVNKMRAYNDDSLAELDQWKLKYDQLVRVIDGLKRERESLLDECRFTDT